MPSYDIFNPELPDSHEAKSEELNVSGEKVLKQRSRSDNTKVRRSKHPDSRQDSVHKETVKKTVKEKKVRISREESLVKKVVDFVHSPSLRIIAGTLVVFIAAYLTVAYISFLKDSFADQSDIENLAVGTANVKNFAGEGGARITQFLVNDCFGLGSAVIVFWLVMVGLKLLSGSSFVRFKTVNFTIKCLVALITVSLIIGLLTIAVDSHVSWGGYHGQFVNAWIICFFGWIGAALLCLFMIIVFVAICLNDVVQWFLRKKRERDMRKAKEAEIRALEEERERERAEMEAQDARDAAIAGDGLANNQEVANDNPDVLMSDSDRKAEDLEIGDLLEEEKSDLGTDADNDSKPLDSQIEDTAFEKIQGTNDVSIPDSADAESGLSAEGKMKVRVNHIGEAVDPEDSPEVFDPHNSIPDYKFPPFALLKAGSPRISIDSDEQLANKGSITRTLADFGIPIKSIEATVGPTVTLYEIVPEDGVKIAKIRGLVDDIAMRLKAEGVRIIAPIPGKGTVGIEVANRERQTVSMRTILTSQRFQNNKCSLPMAIGSTISNEVYMADLAKMPHLLVAGATGQGKSVGLNAIIVSLLYSKHPSELKFVMIDPKRVELSMYSALEKHYLAKLPGEDRPIITDMKKVVPVLSSLCVEMEDRYTLLEEGRVKDIREYNEKYINNKLPVGGDHRFLPYIVLVVDEFADLMMTAGKEVEKPIIRLAQKARAVGIHLIIATQRPSTDVITGLIKANFPSRIAFKVSSGIDSKTILNSTSAYQLVGKGDMLVSDNSSLERVQCAFCATSEVESICAYIEQQPGEPSVYILPEPEVKGEGEEAGFGGGGIVGDRDPLFNEVARLVVTSGIASTSNIQRRFSIGYNRAGKIMDQMEAAGIVGPATGGKRRAVLVDSDILESIING